MSKLGSEGNFAALLIAPVEAEVIAKLSIPMIGGSYGPDAFQAAYLALFH
jgi:hypothetical protein